MQKVLHRYIDEAPLFERVDARLKSSNELLLLRPDENSEGLPLVPDHPRLDRGRDRSEGKAIYTTRSMLKAERALVEAAEELGISNTHGVNSKHTEQAISKANKELEDKGGLSQDQVKAIHHLVDEGQIKCVVGIAGAGKTTALGVCHDIWESEGYAVYGLAPTGKASQNLDQNGIDSTTLHKFLKAFAEDRCQYNKDSVLVLDEAGMVDVALWEASERC